MRFYPSTCTLEGDFTELLEKLQQGVLLLFSCDVGYTGNCSLRKTALSTICLLARRQISLSNGTALMSFFACNYFSYLRGHQLQLVEAETQEQAIIIVKQAHSHEENFLMVRTWNVTESLARLTNR